MTFRSARRSGSLLVITLWLVVILSVLAVAIGRYLSLELRLSRYQTAREQARALAHSGIFLAMQRLAADLEEDGYDWLEDDWARAAQADPQADPSLWIVPAAWGQAGTGSSTSQVAIAMTDEERKLDLHTLTAATLGPLITSDSVAQAIIDYIDQDQAGPWEATVADPPYYPKNGPVAALEELGSIPGMTAEIFSRLRATTFALAGTAPITKVNINTAQPDVLLAIGLSQPIVDGIVGFRQQGHYFRSLSPIVETDGPSPPFDPSDTQFLNALNHLTVGSHFFTITATGRAQGSRALYQVVACVQRGASEEPKVELGGKTFRILSWREG
jgi:type II secretory pathway component PulK